MITFRKFMRGAFSTTLAVIVVVTSFALVVDSAEAARRLGGGKSFGRQTMNRDAMPPAKAPAQNAAQPSQSPPAAAPQPAGNRWMGPLAGIAAGLGIAGLLSHFGLGDAFAGALGNILVLALLIFGGLFLWRMIKRPASAQGRSPLQREAFQTAAPTQAGSSATTNAYGAPIGIGGTAAPAPSTAPVAETSSIPADFDVEGFLRIGKVNFNRLQAAWDAGNLDDIRKFTTPEVFAEIKMQRDEDTGTASRHDVENLQAQLLGIETTAEDYVASVRFSGTIREDGSNAEPFEEIWNLVKPVNGRSGWLLGGIQQVH